jgi:hypothetical protein
MNAVAAARQAKGKERKKGRALFAKVAFFFSNLSKEVADLRKRKAVKNSVLYQTLLLRQLVAINCTSIIVFTAQKPWRNRRHQKYTRHRYQWA